MNVGKLVDNEPDVYQYQQDDNWVDSRLKVGLEIDIENPQRKELDIRRLMPWWKMHEDGSLRDGGFELSLVDPLFGVDLTNAVKAAETVVGAIPELVTNYRTGFHVHLDCRHLESPELLRIFVIYGLFERSVFSFVGDSRDNNNFCAPWFRISDHLNDVMRGFTTKEEDLSEENDPRLILRGIQRYSALNCNALIKFGSIEFRHLQMTKDFTRIRNWINLLMSIYKAGRNKSRFGPAMPDEELLRFASKGGASEIAREIFPEWFLKHVNDKNIWEGIMLVRDLITPGSGNLQSFNSGNRSLLFGICPKSMKSTNLLKFLSIYEKGAA